MMSVSVKKCIIILFSIAVIAPAFWIYYWFSVHKLQSCESTVENIGPSYNGMRAIMVNKLCDGIASSDDVSIAINMPDGSSAVIMEYGAAYSFVRDEREANPNILWNEDGSILISIGAVSYIKKKADSINGMHVQYDIGKIMFNK